MTLDTELRAMIPPRSAPGHFSVLCQALEQAEVGGEAPLSGLLHALAGRIKRRGLIVILSDGFDKLDDLTSALRHLRHRRHEVLFLHVLAPEEEEFPFRRPARFRDLESLGEDPPGQPVGRPRGLPGEVRGVLPRPQGGRPRDGRRLPQGLDRHAPRTDPARLPRRPIRPGTTRGMIMDDD